MSKCNVADKKAAGNHLASALGHGMQKYSKVVGRRSSTLKSPEHKAMVPASVISHFVKIRNALKEKYNKVVEAKKTAKAAKKAVKEAQSGGAPKKYTSTTEVRKDIALAESHVKTMKAVQEAATAAQKEIVAVMQKYGSRYECLPSVDFSIIKKTNLFYNRIAKAAATMSAKDTKKAASLKKRLDSMVKARNAAAVKKAAAKKVATAKKTATKKSTTKKSA
jgi:hypothetical protein